MTRSGPGAAADALASLAESLAVLLDAGLSPPSAWAALAEQQAHPLAADVVAALQRRPSVAAALRAAVATDDARAMAAAWQVAEDAGAPLGRALRTIAETVRDVAEAERDADVALSGPRATARLVSWLPALGAILAAVLGADVVGAARTAPGAIAVGCGLGQMLAGRWWMRAMVRRSLVRGPVPGLAEELAAVCLSGGASAGASLDEAERAAREAGLPRLDMRSARAIIQLAESAGAPAVELLSASARQCRRSARADARKAAATLGVRLMLPLGLCVLPSFLLLAVVPLVLSLLSSTTAGLQ